MTVAYCKDHVVGVTLSLERLERYMPQTLDYWVEQGFDETILHGLLVVAIEAQLVHQLDLDKHMFNGFIDSQPERHLLQLFLTEFPRWYAGLDPLLQSLSARASNENHPIRSVDIVDGLSDVKSLMLITTGHCESELWTCSSSKTSTVLET